MERCNRGYLLVESVLALFICILVLSLGLACLKLSLPNYNSKRYENLLVGQTFLFLQQELNVGINEVINGNSLCYMKFGENFCFELKYDKLIKTPGSDIYLLNVNDIYFYDNENFITVKISVNNEIYEKKIFK